jgi:Lrp/AsnC family leucine-responsive transcriptional regulator
MNDRQNLDSIDKAILTLLQDDGTLPNATLANKVKLSPSPCLIRTRRLREEGIIQKTVAIVDEKKIGLETVAFTFVTLSPHNRQMAEAFVGRIRNTSWVLECYNITGNWDYLLKIVAPDIGSYRNFVLDELLDMPAVQKVETLVVLRTEKRSFCLPIETSNKEAKR